eukprot:scaffold27430_cov112-Isochrysis_galbana.AAC.1
MQGRRREVTVVVIAHSIFRREQRSPSGAIQMWARQRRASDRHQGLQSQHQARHGLLTAEQWHGERILGRQSERAVDRHGLIVIVKVRVEGGHTRARDHGTPPHWALGVVRDKSIDVVGTLADIHEVDVARHNRRGRALSRGGFLASDPHVLQNLRECRPLCWINGDHRIEQLHHVI